MTSIADSDTLQQISERHVTQGENWIHPCGPECVAKPPLVGTVDGHEHGNCPLPAQGEYLEDPRDDQAQPENPIVATTPQGFPIGADGEILIKAMTLQQKADFWAFCDAEERKAKDYYGGYKTAVAADIELDIRRRREQNAKAIAVPHKTLRVEMEDQFTRYQFNDDLLPDIAQALADDEFEKIAKFVPEFRPDPVPAHWDIKSTASGTVKSLIEKYDGTALADLLRKFMWRDKTGENLVIEYRKGAQKNVTPKAVA